MLKVRKDNIVMLGLDAENVKRLQQNQPILVKGSELGLDVDIYITYGETFKDIINEYGLQIKVN